MEESEACQVFGVCRAVIKNDRQVALYLLPYVTVHMLLEGNDTHRNEVGNGNGVYLLGDENNIMWDICDMVNF